MDKNFDFKKLFEIIPVMVCIASTDGYFKYLNPEWEKILGYSLEELFSESLFHFIHPDDHKITLREIERQKKGNMTLNFENRYRCKDGSYKIFEWRATAAEGDNLFAVAKDITEQKKIMNERELLAKAIENSLNGFDIVNGEGKFIYVNNAYAKMWGYDDPSEIIGGSPASHCHDPAVPEQIIKNLKQYGKYELELKAMRKDGSTFDALMSANLMFDEMGNDLYTGTSIDISERKRAEKEKTNLRDQLYQAQKMESVGRLAGGVAHDYNNMLSVILGYTELVMEKVTAKNPLHTYLREIQSAARRSADITRQLLAFSRKQTIAPQVLDLNETVEGMLKMLRRLIGEDINLAWYPSPHLRPLFMDSSQLDQIFVNLCVNARDAIEDVGKITIETNMYTFDATYCAANEGFRPGDYVAIEVSDNGCGMDKETQSKIFEPFYTTKQKGKGTGLGLATVYGIVKQNDGFINVYSEPGHGTTFRIYFPCHEIALARAKKVTRIQPDYRGAETILLVEDEESILKMTKIMLERMGYKVLATNAPLEAIDIASNHDNKIHLLITDVVMPAMNGKDLSLKIQALHPEIKVLFMSGYTSNVIAHHDILDGGVNFIQKPFSKANLGETIRKTLDIENV